MKAREVLKILQVTRPTLWSYTKTGKIRSVLKTNRFRDYNEDDVLRLAGIEKREVVIYARVSTPGQKQSLDTQIETLKQYANSNGLSVTDVYADVASGLNFDRKEFKKLIENVIERKIKCIII